MAIAVMKTRTVLPITTELMMDAGWTKAYPTWADAESTPMWCFEDEVMLVPPTWSFTALLEFNEDAEFEPLTWLDDDDEEEYA